MAVEKDYLQKLFTEAGAPAEQVQALFGNEKLAKTLIDGFSRQEDYSRNMDQLRAQEKKAQDTYQENLDWYQAQLGNLSELDNYRQRFGALNPDLNNNNNNQHPTFDPNKYISKEAFEKAVKEARDNAISTNVTITKEAIRASTDYQYKFGKPLDLDALEKYALEKNLPLRTAYQEFIQPELETKMKAEEESRIKTAVDDRVKAELSKHNIPIDSAPREPHMIFDRKEDAAPADERSRMAGFAETWNQAEMAKR